MPERIIAEDDGRLLEWGFGVTNLIARPSRGIDSLRPIEYVEGWRVLEKKIRRYRPKIVAFVGVTLYRAILPLLDPSATQPALKKMTPLKSVVGLQPQAIHASRLFVLPNPSGRNANFSYQEMLSAFRELKRIGSDRGLPRSDPGLTPV